MDFDTIADELYGLPPQDFTGVRNERAKAARASGDPALAAQVQALRKPNAVAWLTNQLVRHHREEVDSLLGLGPQLREATAALHGSELRLLDAQLRKLVQALGQQARALAAASGHPVSDKVEQGVVDSLRAALADSQASASLTAGRLTDALPPPGFGGSPADEQTESAPPAPVTAMPAGGQDADGPTAAQLEQARREVAEADEQAETARQALEQTRATLHDATTRAREATDRVKALRLELAEATAARETAEQEETDARSAHDRADRAADQAEQRLRETKTVLAERSQQT